MSTDSRSLLGKAIVESTQEASEMMMALLQHLLAQTLKRKELNDAEKAHIAACQLVCVLSLLNDHLARIGDSNFAVLSRQIQALIETERKGNTKVAGLAKLAALLLPLSPLMPVAKN